MGDNPVKKEAAPKKEASKVETALPILFKLFITAAEMKNLIALINSATIKGEASGAVEALKQKILSATPPAPKPEPKKEEVDGGPNQKDK